MTDRADQRLEEWGAWQRAIRGDNLGLPNQDLVRRAIFGGYRQSLPDNADAEETEMAVCQLRLAWRWVVVDYYVKQQPIRIIADKFGKSERTIDYWLAGARGEIEEALYPAKSVVE